jgi:hypothetical protein
MLKENQMMIKREDQFAAAADKRQAGTGKKKVGAKTTLIEP